MKTVFKFACLGAAALAVSGCSLPNFDTNPETVQLAPVVKPVVKKPVVAAPAPAQAAAEVVEPKPKKPFGAHVPIGNSPDLSDGDEDSGWG